VQLALAHSVPIVAAGRTEDKIEVNARVAHSGVGINLRTQSPRPDQLRDAVRRVLGEPNFRERARSVQREINELGREEPAVAELEWLAATDLVSAEDCTYAA
jgi:UDP:flavonoid glycosyltransferase YjiC (YdhE family)